MAMLGSVVTRDMFENRIYGGAPAKDLTDKLGPQFEARTINQKLNKLNEILRKFEAKHPEYVGQLLAVAISPDSRRDDFTYFNVAERTYTQRLSEAEVAFLKANTPLVKFIPDGAPPLFEPGVPAHCSGPG
jgi:hypothetical protein